jgi:putative tricarboxylic transport membrane protein
LILISCVLLTLVGTFTINSSIFDVFVLIVFGAIGYFMRRYGYPVAATSIAVILGSGLEANLRQGLLLSHRSWWEFVTRPWTRVILGIAVVLLIYATFGTIKMARRASANRRRALDVYLASRTLEAADRPQS